MMLVLYSGSNHVMIGPRISAERRRGQLPWLTVDAPFHYKVLFIRWILTTNGVTKKMQPRGTSCKVSNPLCMFIWTVRIGWQYDDGWNSSSCAALL